MWPTKFLVAYFYRALLIHDESKMGVCFDFSNYLTRHQPIYDSTHMPLPMSEN